VCTREAMMSPRMNVKTGKGQISIRRRSWCIPATIHICSNAGVQFCITDYLR
jgi:hypothetical protein